MTIAENEQSTATRTRAARVGQYLLLAWILATAFFYFIRFTAIFIRANAAAMEPLLERLGLV